MALSTVADYQAALNQWLWWVENRFGVHLGHQNQDGSAQVGPVVDQIVRTGYVPQNATAETNAYTDVNSILSSYFSYKKTRQSFAGGPGG